MGAWNSGLQSNKPPTGPWGTPGVATTPPDQQANPQPTPSNGKKGGFFANIGQFLKENSGAIADIGNQLAAAGGNTRPLELAHQDKELKLQQALADSNMQNQALNRQLLQKQIENYESPEQRNARELKQAGAITEQQKEFEKPTDVVAPMPEGGMGHYNQKWNPTTKQYETSPTMVPSPPQQNAGGFGPVPSTMPPTTAGTAPQPPQFNPMTGGTQQLPPTAVPSAPHQLPAMTKGGPEKIEKDDNSSTGFSYVSRGPLGQELYRVPNAPAPYAYVGSTTSGSNTVLKDTPEGQVPVVLPHSSTKTPILPTKPGGTNSPTNNGEASTPPTMPGVHAGAPILDSKASADEARRAELGQNLNENLDKLEDIAKRRPELFGPPSLSGPNGPTLGGRGTTVKQLWGTDDPDVAALKTIKEQMGLAMVGAHAMRNAQHAIQAADSIVNGLNNAPEALLGPKGTIQTARDSVKTFISDVQGNRPTRNSLQRGASSTKPQGKWNPVKGVYE